MKKHTYLKKLVSLILIAVFILVTTTTPVFATQLSYGKEIEYEDDGSYLITEINTDEISLLSTTVTKSKTSTYYSSSGKAMWCLTVTGTFTYGGNSSKCTSASVSGKSYSSSWKLTNKSSSVSGNKASASATAIMYSGNAEVKRISRTVTLTCSSTGKFS